LGEKLGFWCLAMAAEVLLSAAYLSLSGCCLRKANLPPLEVVPPVIGYAGGNGDWLGGVSGGYMLARGNRRHVCPNCRVLR
jgi:hypothetical protein